MGRIAVPLVTLVSLRQEVREKPLAGTQILKLLKLTGVLAFHHPTNKTFPFLEMFPLSDLYSGKKKKHI